MSDEDVRFVRGQLERYIAGDEDAVWAMWAEDAIGIPPEDWPESSPMRGRDAIRERFASFGDAFGPDWARQMTIEDATDAGQGRVLVEFTWHPSGLKSGAAVEQGIAGVYTVRGGKVVRGEFYSSHRRAREALGPG